MFLRNGKSRAKGTKKLGGRTGRPTLQLRTLHVASAVDVQLLAGDVVALGGQECGGLGYFCRSRKASQRNLGLELVGIFFRKLLQDLRRSISRCNGVGRDVVL